MNSHFQWVGVSERASMATAPAQPKRRLCLPEAISIAVNLIGDQIRKHISSVRWLLLFIPFTVQAQLATKLSLREAMSRASENNPTVLSARREIDAAAGRVLQSGRIPNPELSITFNETPSNLRLGDAGEQDIGLSQTIEFPGKRGSRIEFAEHGRTIAEHALTRVQVIVASQVKNAYYRVLLTREVMENLEFSIGLVGDFLRVVTDRYQAGSSSYVDVIRTKVEVTRLRNDLVETERDFQVRRSELNMLLGSAVDAQFVLTDSMVYEPFMVSRDSVMSVYEGQSSFLKTVEREVDRSRSLLSLSQKSYLPDFNLGIATQRRPGQISPSGSDRYLGFQFGLSVPLWFWQGPKGEVQEAEAIVDISRFRLEAAQRLVRQRIANAYRDVIVAEEQVRVFETSLLSDTEDELRSGISAYQNNQINAIDLFDIYRTYRATKFEYARALFNHVSAKSGLESAGEVSE